MPVPEKLLKHYPAVAVQSGLSGGLHVGCWAGAEEAKSDKYCPPRSLPVETGERRREKVRTRDKMDHLICAH